MAYWLVKTEPEEYSYADLERAGQDIWDGVRSHAAKKHLSAMTPGDEVFIYHTGTERAIVGVGEVIGPAHPDPTDPTEKWVAVDLRPVGRLRRPISLAEVKELPELAEWELVRVPRLSVMPVPVAIWDRILSLAAT